jgi:tyrosine-specific transport protein
MIRRDGLLGATLLISGTTIGAAMIALPVSTAAFGWIGTCLLFCLFWFLMAWTGLLFCEATLSLPEGTNLTSMVRHYLGPIGESATWILYLCLLYALNAAYLTGLGEMLSDLTGLEQIPSVSLIIVLFSLMMLISSHLMDWCNRILMLLFIISFLVMGGLLLPHASMPDTAIHWTHVWPTFSIVVTGFGFHIILPSLRDLYPERAASMLPKAVMIGSFFPLCMYVLWEWLVMGNVSPSALTALIGHAPTVGLRDVLSHHIRHGLLSPALYGLTLAVVMTSFIGVSLSMFDFLKDGLDLVANRQRFAILLLTFLPPFVFIMLYPHAFIMALSYAGIFVALLLVILPMLLVYVIRRRGHHASYRAPFHPVLILVGLVMSVLIVFSQFSGAT